MAGGVNRGIDEFGQSNGLESRQAVRHSVLLMAALSGSDGRPLGQVKVRNISSTGLMAETGLPLKNGDVVEVALRGIGAVRAVVVRRTLGKVALKFDLPIDPLLTRQKI